MEGERTAEGRMAGVKNQPMVADDEQVKKSSVDGPGAAAAGGGCFDCNICLDFAAEPVVTLCGHLYCWPCIYEWLRPAAAAETASSSLRRQCPVCKATLSPDTLVPLYGRGGSSKKLQQHGPAIPRRPAAHREAIVEHQSTPSSASSNVDARPPLQQRQQAAGLDFVYPPSPTFSAVAHSTAGAVLGGMAVAVLPWAMRGQAPVPSMYYSSPYYVAAHNVSPRLRRQQLEVERSLHHICFFLFVFVVLCLLLF